MDTLLELTAILDRKRLSKIDVLDKTFLNSRNDNLYYKLYSGLISGKYSDDQIACKAIYGTDRPDYRYRVLKSRLKNKLLKTLLLLDSRECFINNEKNRNYFECAINLNTIEILVKIKGINKIVYELVQEKYNKAYFFKFYDILKSYSYYLLAYYSLNGESKKYEKEYIKYLTYIEASKNELEVKQLNSRIILLFYGAKPINKKFLSEAKKYIDQLSGVIQKFPDPEALFFYYHALTVYKENSAEYHELLHITNAIDNLFIQYPFIATTGRLTINKIYKIKIFLHLKQYGKAIKLINTSKSKMPDFGSYNWLVAKEFEFKIYLHSKNPLEANRICNEVTKNIFFKRSYSHQIEKWKIYEAYLVFLDNFLNKGTYKFSVAKFINEVSFYSKDKSGFNFAVRIIELLFLFAKKQYNVIFAKMDALKVYRSRYLNDDTYLRSRLFLTALLKAEKDGFNAKKMKKGYPEIVRIKSKNRQLIIADWEILPYEMVWDILVDLAKE